MIASLKLGNTSFRIVRNTSFRIVLICLFIYSALIPMPLSNFVLCIGEDGHFEVELAINGHCEVSPSHAHDHTHLSCDSEEDHCGDCVDLPIFASLNTESYIVSCDHTPQFHQTHITSIQTSDDLDEFGFCPQITFSKIPPLINPSLTLLRSTTLLL